jgi:hypothetical protein
LSESFKMNERQFKCTNYHICSRNASFTDPELELPFCGTLCHLGYIELNSKESFKKVVKGKKLPDFKVSMEYPEMTLKITKNLNGKYVRIDTTHFMLLTNEQEDYTFATDLPKQMQIVSKDINIENFVDYEKTYTRLIVRKDITPRNYDRFIISYNPDPSKTDSVEIHLDLIVINPKSPDFLIHIFPTLNNVSVTVKYYDTSEIDENTEIIKVERSREKEYYILLAANKTNLALYERSLTNPEEPPKLSKYAQNNGPIMVLKIPPPDAKLKLLVNAVHVNKFMRDKEGKLVIDEANLAVLLL